ncbi:unnamed protein product [Adineta ricciae]|uniref:Uncharacterized protein n=1 Tax=Adineta ricciae TaxID=249248 RepID=A0A816E2J4_ADIRI|nr:unnamed protein product [Adineta ricciae]CAF1640559.1 unnamed protein product [Adineta ricciae]
MEKIVEENALATEMMPIILETDRCHIRDDENINSEQEDLVKSSVISIPLVHTQQTNPTTTSSFEQIVIDELRSIKTTLNSVNRRLTNIEKKTDVIYEMTSGRIVIPCCLFFNDCGVTAPQSSQPRTSAKKSALTATQCDRNRIHALHSLGITGIEGFSCEFYHYYEYSLPLNSLANELQQHYYNR